MKVKQIYVEAKKSRNFQTYTVGITADVTDEESLFKINELQARCRKLALEQIALDSVYPRKGIHTDFITGSHDLSFYKRAGTDIGERVDEK